MNTHRFREHIDKNKLPRLVYYGSPRGWVAVFDEDGEWALVVRMDVMGQMVDVRHKLMRTPLK